MEAKQVRDLMEAYASVYTQSEEQEVLSEDLQKAVEKGLDAAAKNPVVQAIGKVIAPVGKGRGTVTKAEQEAKIKSNKQEDVDLFDLVKGHLLDEGYADTEEAALVIMSNMSEEWRESIIEAKYGTKAGRHKLAMKRVKGKEIGKSGPGTGFKEVEKRAKEGGAEDPAAVAAAAMYKTYGGKKGKKKG